MDKYVEIIGNSEDYTFHINHNLGTKDIIVQVYKLSTGGSYHVLINRINDNEVMIGFDEKEEPPKAGMFKVVIIG